MSEQDNTQLVKSMFEAFQKGDVPGVLDTLTEDVEWRLAGPTEVTYAGIRRGRDQVAQVFKVLGEASVFEQFELHDYIAVELDVRLPVVRRRPLRDERQ